jgi:hypothetical protein
MGGVCTSKELEKDMQECPHRKVTLGRGKPGTIGQDIGQGQGMRSTI